MHTDEHGCRVDANFANCREAEQPDLNSCEFVKFASKSFWESVFIRTTISQNLRTPRKFFLLVLVLVLALDWVSGLDYEDEDDDEEDSVAAAPLRDGKPWASYALGA